MKIYRAQSVTPALSEAATTLMPQLFEAPSMDWLSKVVEDRGTILMIAEEESLVVGMLAVCICRTPSACKAWIEDVVVDSAFRGRGVGRALVRQGCAEAWLAGATKICLTSNVKRKEAHSLYLSEGFECYDETRVFVNRRPSLLESPSCD
eukprot:Gregarina_sp_Poly_1__8898@NODE_537_length_7626_cov_271_043524_g424_i0_p3_GENE_NODE_537_length_7626_cov_271_043524_g424_i0NODE_537_length_7626_cov_271_043524_g424_i0_p3_ORF_typecomplete_len150_score21_82Acetyltransf_1/PF00583_25/1_1e15Acetyltransf_10/PF13673_7/3_4e14Acetyltransf_7/PF13508_7/2_1e11Acetyltransf_9/PF13527_7/2_6e07Acetyltransf_4/PF13420_7/4_1e07PanZ/PF12568_8/1_1e06FR47/PF08445_10/1_9e05GNAT_acetyltran/PF12746_7/3_1e05Acetyltransf_8/PF13523_6/0_00044Acetyltransf_CG/PF14542_6/0_0026Ac